MLPRTERYHGSYRERTRAIRYRGMDAARFFAWLLPLIVLVGTITVTTLARADGDPTGFWTTIDDDCGIEKAVVEIVNYRGTLHGKIVSLMNPAVPNPKCEKCSGKKKNKPIIGLEIIWGLTQDGEEWSGGYILDPETGDEYRCYIEVIDGGERLKVRGYLGVALLGRTQYWQRAESPARK
jgi:uncharacterized protein (DUF2147 family)